MKDWLKKDPDNIIYFISFVLIFGIGVVCILSLAAMFE